MAVEVLFPRIDPTMTEGMILEWKKEEGETVAAGDCLFVIETQKVTVEVEAEGSGKLAKILCKAGETVVVGTVVAWIIQEGEKIPEILSPKGTTTHSSMPCAAAEASSQRQPKVIENASFKSVKATPLAKRIASEKGIDISLIMGTGPGGRVRKDDVINFQKASAKDETPQMPGEIISLSSMRKTIAERMSESFKNVPHFYLNTEIDMLSLIEGRKKILPAIQTQTGCRVTLTDIFIKVVAKAIEDNPQINVQWSDGDIVKLAEINIGIAVNIDNGLVVPVVREADKKSLSQIAQCRSELVVRARESRLTFDEMKGGSITITNLGMLGIDMLNPIINSPESCILGIGRTIEKPVVLDGEVVIRPRAILTLSIDHRVLDGGSGSIFFRRIKELIESPLLMI